jgi:hypothetical protein
VSVVPENGDTHERGRVASEGFAFLAVDPATAFDYVQQTAVTPGSGITADAGAMLCEVTSAISADELSHLLAPDMTQGSTLNGSVTADTSASLRHTRNMTWSAVQSSSALQQWNASNASMASQLSSLAATGETAIAESSLLLRLAAMAVQDVLPGSAYGALGGIARLFMRTPAQERGAMLWDGENVCNAMRTLVALASKGQKSDQSGALQNHLSVLASSVATLYVSARAYALSRACAGADGIAAEHLAVMGSARLNSSFQVAQSSPARALRRARIVIASLAYRQPLLLAVLLQSRSALVSLCKAWGDAILDPAVCPLPPLPRLVLAHVHADAKHGMPMGVELAELLD